MASKVAIANNYKGPFDPEFLRLSDEQIQVLMIMHTDQGWAESVSKYRNISESIKEYNDQISKTDYEPRTDDEKILYDIYFKWLDMERPMLSWSTSPATKRREDRKIILLSDDGDDEEGG